MPSLTTYAGVLTFKRCASHLVLSIANKNVISVVRSGTAPGPDSLFPDRLV